MDAHKNDTKAGLIAIHQVRAKPVKGYPVSTAWDDVSPEGLAHARTHPSSYEVRTVYIDPTQLD